MQSSSSYLTWAVRPTMNKGGLAVSNIGFLLKQKEFERKKIIAVLSLLTYENNHMYYKKLESLNKGLVLINKRIFIKDDQNSNIKQHFKEGIAFIDANITVGNVLVHCVHGRSRSPSMALAYMMQKRRIPLEDALGILKSQCELIQPNSGFLKQLKEYETELGICEESIL